jgi:hypothetical protein
MRAIILIAGLVALDLASCAILASMPANKSVAGQSGTKFLCGVQPLSKAANDAKIKQTTDIISKGGASSDVDITVYVYFAIFSNGSTTAEGNAPVNY